METWPQERYYRVSGEISFLYHDNDNNKKTKNNNNNNNNNKNKNNNNKNNNNNNDDNSNNNYDMSDDGIVASYGPPGVLVFV